MISIAMATYNGEKFIKEQIDSILCQTIKPSEIVICDDCSTDNTWNLLQQYADRDSCFRIYRNEHNLGFCKNFEKALSLCVGDYIALSDQDDIWMDNHIELLLNGMGNKIMSCGNALLVDETGTSLGITWRDMEQLDYIPNDDIKKLQSILFFRNPYQGASMLFKRELLLSAMPFPEGTLFHDRWLPIVACLAGGINYVDTIVLHYRRTNENVTSTRCKRNRIREVLHGWTMGSGREIDQLFAISNLSISEKSKKILLEWKHILRNNIRWRKPITIAYLIKNYRTIYSC